MGILDILGLGDKNSEIKDFIEKGAVIIDVRTVGEFESGHITDSKNIPLDTITEAVGSIKSLNKPVIACCRSGMRSGQATSILKQHGIDVINGGGWEDLNSRLN
ncbi:rhodanese-like domain-containing protein [Flavobacterium amniphilum]|uniref:rhodanese-like domain-containing protein n=1 Tax=Flavobacterium amniphilum TaxID=1834035 RepID=UPI002029C4E0|nr:rhodanese-like domain-containing protein [Flavobacterium amniphilum]MCL9804626.1 rhodanese-like domain-containing protein [Flavobacterium amniphilum]